MEKLVCSRCGHSKAVHYNGRGACNICPREVYNIHPDGSRVRVIEDICRRFTMKGKAKTH